MDLKETIALISNAGVPVVILFWILFKLEKHLAYFFNHFSTITSEIQKMRVILDLIASKITGVKHED